MNKSCSGVLKRACFATGLVAAFGCQAALITFQEGKVARAADVNANFSQLENELVVLGESVATLTKPDDLSLSVDCTTQGAQALGEVIAKHQNSPRSLNVVAAGRCGPFEVKKQRVTVQIAEGTTPLVIESRDTSTISVTDGGRLTLINAEIDSKGLGPAINASDNSSVIMAFNRIASETGGLSLDRGSIAAFIGPNTITSVGAGLTLNQSQGMVTTIPNLPPATCLTGSSVSCLIIDSPKALDLNHGSSLVVDQPRTSINFQTTEIEMEHSSHLALRAGEISASLVIARFNSTISAAGATDEHFQLNADVELQSGSLMDLDYDDMGSFAGMPNIEVQLGATLNVNGLGVASPEGMTGQNVQIASENLTLVPSASTSIVGVAIAGEVSVLGGDLVTDIGTYTSSTGLFSAAFGGSIVVFSEGSASPAQKPPAKVVCSTAGTVSGTAFWFQESEDPNLCLP